MFARAFGIFCCFCFSTAAAAAATAAAAAAALRTAGWSCSVFYFLFELFCESYMVVDVVVQNPQKSNVYEYEKKHVRRDSKMCCCCCRFCCGAPTTDERIHAPVLHDASQILYCRYCGRASLPPITSSRHEGNLPNHRGRRLFTSMGITHSHWFTSCGVGVSKRCGGIRKGFFETPRTAASTCCLRFLLCLLPDSESLLR